MKAMSSTSHPRKSISGGGLPSQAEARAVLEGFKKMLKPTTERQIRGMLAHWNDVGLAMDSKVDHPEYITACIKKWLPLPAVFIAWAEEEWLGRSDFFPKPAGLLKLAEPYLVKWRQTHADLSKLAHWEREKPFVKLGTVEARRAIIAASLKRVAKTSEEGKEPKHG